MARTVNSSFTPVPVSHWSTSRPVHEGSASSQYGELDIIENNNFLLAHYNPPIVRCTFRPEGSGYLAGAATSYGAANCVWRRRPAPDFAQYQIKIVATNTATTSGHAGTVKFEMDSDAANVEIAVPENTSAQTTFTGDLAYDNSETLDNIEMYIKNGATGVCRVWSVHIAPKPLTALSAGLMESGAVPMDSIAGVQDAPLTVYHRELAARNCETLRKTRVGTCVSYADDFTRATAGQYEETSATFQLVAVVPFRTMPGEVALEWALFGHRDAAGSGGGVKLVSSFMEAEGTTPIEVTLGTAWSSPYNGSDHDYTNVGETTLLVAEATTGHVKVYLKGDGTKKAWLMGLAIWPKAVT